MSWDAKLIARRDMRARQAVVTEAQAVARILTEPWLWLLAVVTLLAGSLAYRAPYDLVLDIGGSPDGCYADAVFDTPYIEGFNPEPEFDGPPALCTERRAAFRWAFEDAALRLRGLGYSAYSVVLQITTGQPSGQTVLSAMAANAVPTLAVPVRPEGRAYHIFVPPSPDPHFELHFHTPPYQPPGDVRGLAFALDRVGLSTIGAVRPDWRQLTTLSGIVAVGYVMARRWSVKPILAAVVALVGTAVLVGLLLWQRHGLTSFSARALQLMLVGFGLSVVLELLAHHVARRLRVVAPGREIRVVVALVVVAWLVRVLGLFHPQTFSSDVGLHINNLLGVSRGEIIFTEGLPAEAGGGAAPYPPAQYIVLAPWQLLPMNERTLVTGANALADSLVIFWCWLVLRRSGAPATAAYAAGALYLFATPLLRSLSTGEMANVWGQALVMPWLLMLLLWRQHGVQAGLLSAATAIVLLGHSGVFLSLGLLLATLGTIWLVRGDRRVWAFALVVGIAVVAVVVGYYLAFLDVIGQRAAPAVTTTTPLQRLGLEARELVLPNGQIGPMIAGMGLVGTALAWRRCRELGEVLVAWWLSCLLSWGTLLFSQQALRWEAFLFPALVLGGGFALEALWRLRSALRWAAPAFIGATLVHGAALWVQRLITYR